MSNIGYARVSTKDQDLSAQLEELEKAGCQKIFHGKQSGKSDDNQVKLQEMLEYVRDGDTVILTKLDRMGRSLNKILTVITDLEARGVAVKTLDGQVDTASESPMQKAMTQLLGVFAELEHAIIVDRLQSGRKRTGKLGGRARLFDDEQAEAIRQSFLSGVSKKRLAQDNKCSRATIRRLVSGLDVPARIQDVLFSGTDEEKS